MQVTILNSTLGRQVNTQMTLELQCPAAATVAALLAEHADDVCAVVADLAEVRGCSRLEGVAGQAALGQGQPCSPSLQRGWPVHLRGTYGTHAQALHYARCQSARSWPLLPRCHTTLARGG